MFERNKTMRNLKEKVSGVRKIQDDPIDSQRSEIDELATVNEKLSHAIGRFEEALKAFGEANMELSESVENFFPPDSPYHTNLKYMKSTMEIFRQALETTSPSLFALRSNVTENLTSTATIRAELTDRDRAHNLKKHYDKKLSGLQTQASNGKANHSKLGRNSVKMSNSLQDFEQKDALVREHMEKQLSTKYSNMAKTLSMYSRFLHDYFSITGQRVQSLLSTEERFNSLVSQYPSTPVFLAPLKDDTGCGYVQQMDSHGLTYNDFQLAGSGVTCASGVEGSGGIYYSPIQDSGSSAHCPAPPMSSSSSRGGGGGGGGAQYSTGDGSSKTVASVAQAYNYNPHGGGGPVMDTVYRNPPPTAPQI